VSPLGVRPPYTSAPGRRPREDHPALEKAASPRPFSFADSDLIEGPR
jgi:hypothetical protein